MQELRFVAVSEDGSYAVLAVPGRSGRYVLPIDERLRAVALGQTSRLAQYEIEVESPLRPKEIQARIRAGETAEEIADAAGIPVERVRWFEGPVLAERAYIADQAQAGSVRRAGDSSGPGPRLGDIVTARLNAAGTDPADGQWDSRKRGDGSWQVSLTFPSGGRLHVAEWVFDPRRRHVMPDDDNAARLSLPESELPPEPVAVPGEATVTPIASRLGAAAGMGGGAYAAGPAVSRFRPDRSVLPDRSLGADRSLADRPATPAASSAPATPAAPAPPAAPVQERHPAAERPPAPAAPARHAQQDRPGYQDRHAGAGYAEFPESAPYRAPEPEPAARRDPAPAYPEATYDDPVPGQPAFRDAEAEPTPPRPVVFEDPEPAFLGELELAPPADRPAPAPEQASPVTAAASPAVSAGPGTAGQTPASGSPAEPAPSTTRDPETARVQVPEPARTESPAAAAAAKPGASAPSVAAPEAVPAAKTAAPPAAAQDMPTVPAPGSAPAAAVAAGEPEGEPAAEDAAGRPRAGAKKTAKGRRSSVPSWDEIMLGSSRQRD